MVSILQTFAMLTWHCGKSKLFKIVSHRIHFQIIGLKKKKRKKERKKKQQIIVLSNGCFAAELGGCTLLSFSLQS